MCVKNTTCIIVVSKFPINMGIPCWKESENGIPTPTPPDYHNL